MSNKEAIEALALAQSQMKTPHKDATNPHFRNRYASLKSCIKAIKPALNSNGFALIQAAGKDEQGHYIQTTFEHTSGGLFTSKFYMEPEKKGMQGLGSAATYAKRYGLLGLAGIEPDEDADDDGNAADEPPAAPKPKLQPKKPDPEAEHDEAVREEQNREPIEIEYKEDILTALQNCKEVWQCDKVVKENFDKFKLIKKYSQEMAKELQAFYNVRTAQIKEGK